LAFTGRNLDDVKLPFSEGLNIVYGASNTGKTFAAKALQFMLGGVSKLPQPQQLKPYSGAWLGLTMPNGRNVTLYRSTRGGDFRLYDGLVTQDTGHFDRLRGSADADRNDTVSHYLLSAIGWSGKVIVKNARGEKENLAVRHVLPYAIVSEGDIMSESSPVHHSRQYVNRTMESNLFRFVLTGTDDHAVVTGGTSKTTHKIATTAKLELIDEMIAQVSKQLGEEPHDRDEVSRQLNEVASSLSSLEGNLRKAQEHLDQLVAERRQLLDTQRDATASASEVAITLQRFAHLDETYSSDRARLESLEEGGLVLMAMAGRDCPVCGAEPHAQRHYHGASEIALAHRAAVAEAKKIGVEQSDLKQTTIALEVEETTLRSLVEKLGKDIANVEGRIEGARPKEISARAEYVRLTEEQAKYQRSAELLERLDSLSIRRSQIAADTPIKNEKLSVGIEGTTAFSLGQTISGVLEKWNFPDVDQVQFDLETGDITIDGKRRADNGKGVRAILHAAFNVGVLLYCRERGLPHPGFLVLDTPLLTYREPLTSRHGELSEDEKIIKNSPVAVNFYHHLSSLDAQIIILENADPPSEIVDHARIHVFTGRRNADRYGLFPV
jgi:hypothetical protein